MFIGFKAFLPFRTVFFVVIMQICVASSAFANAQIFNVEGVEIDITAESAVKAREMAFEKAQMDAFAILKKRMLGEGEAEQFPPQDVSTIGALIQDFQVKDEKLSSVRYIATYDFRFKQDAVKALFDGSGMRYTDMSSALALVLPYYQKGVTTHLWSPYNVWMKAWAAGDHQDGVVPMVVPLGDLQDVRDIREEDGLSYDDRRLDNMLQRYGAGEAIILMAVPDEALAAVNGANDPASGFMKIHVYRTDRGRPEYVQPIRIETRPNDTLSSFMSHAVGRVKNTLRQNWKDRTVADPAQNSTIEARVPISSLQEWAKIQRALRNTYVLKSFELKKLTPSQAMITISFDGHIDRLRTALEGANIVLEREYGVTRAADVMTYYSRGTREVLDTYTLRLRGEASGSREMIYVPGKRY